jgi:hypothetical protein
MAHWTSAKEVPAFSDLFRPVPPPLPQQPYGGSTERVMWPRSDAATAAVQDEALAPPIASAIPTAHTHPWRRYFARLLDLYVFIIFASFVVGLFFSDRPNRSSGHAGEDHFLDLLYIAAYVPFEAFCLYAFDTTLGKALYGITWHTREPGITFSAAFRRSALVWLRIGRRLPYHLALHAHQRLPEP